MSIYFNNPWKPIKHGILKDSSLANYIHDIAYKVFRCLSADSIQDLKDLYDEFHQISTEKGEPPMAKTQQGK